MEEDKATGLYDVVDQVRHRRGCKKYEARRASQASHFRKKAWVAQERRAAKAIGGRLTPASGALNEDGDARQMKGWRAECKMTKTASYRLRQDVWSKLVVGALENGEEPVLFVDVLGNKHSFVLMRTEKAPTQKSKSIRFDTPFGTVLPVDPPAEILSPAEFDKIKDRH